MIKLVPYILTKKIEAKRRGKRGEIRVLETSTWNNVPAELRFVRRFNTYARDIKTSDTISIAPLNTIFRKPFYRG
jgi:hypothetical protein